jgi:TetR/AcrR family transcriptional regulator
MIPASERRPKDSMARSNQRSPLPPDSYTAAPGRLLQAAIKVFAERGFKGTTLRMIAKEADLFFQLITYHFGSKEQLWTATLNHMLDERIAALRATRLNSDKDLRQQLRQWLRTSFLFCIEEPQFFKLMIDLYVAAGEERTKAIEPKLAQFRAEFHDAFRQICKVGAVREFSPEETQILVDSLTVAAVAMPFEAELITGLAVTDPRYAELHVELLVNLLTRGKGVGASRRTLARGKSEE